MSAITRDAAITGLLTIAWITSTLGIAQADRWLTAASAPSLAIALVLHVIGTRRRTPKPEDVLRIAEANTRTERRQ